MKLLVAVVKKPELAKQKKKYLESVGFKDVVIEEDGKVYRLYADIAQS